MIRTYPLTKEFTRPEDAYYRLKAKNGYFFCITTPCWRARVFDASLRKPNRLQHATEEYTLTLPCKLGAATIIEAHSFFASVRSSHRCEALLLWYWHPERQEYLLDAPCQENHPGAVIAAATPAPEGYLEVGTIHSHPGSAFHSATDEADEASSDGVHIVLGHVDRFPPEIVATLAVRGRRFPLNPSDVIDLPYDYTGPWRERLQPQGGRV